MWEIGGCFDADDGRFTIAEVPSGTYHVTASVPIMVSGAGAARSGGLVGGVIGGSYTSWSAGGVTSGVTGPMDPPSEVIVNGANVTGIRVVIRRPPPQ
jgi:hypothetical protein